MFRQMSAALATVAVIGAVAITPTSASAHHWSHGWGHGGFGIGLPCHQDGLLIPAVKDQPPPDLRYFKQAPK